MRKPKRKKTVLENLIRKVWRDTKKGKSIATDEQATVIVAIALTLNHFEEEDRLHNTIHAKIFTTVYLANSPLTQKNYDSKKLLFETAIEMRLDSKGYSILSPIFKNGLGSKREKQKKVTEKTRERLAEETGVCARVLKENTDMYIKCFESKLESINLNYTIPK